MNLSRGRQRAVVCDLQESPLPAHQQATVCQFGRLLHEISLLMWLVVKAQALHTLWDKHIISVLSILRLLIIKNVLKFPICAAMMLLKTRIGEH